MKETGLPSGTLYPLLIRMMERGLIQAEWRAPEQHGRPARHVYRLTAEGGALAQAAKLGDCPAPFKASLA